MLFSMVLVIFLLHDKSSFYFTLKFFYECIYYACFPFKTIIFEFFIFENLYFVFFRKKTSKKQKLAFFVVITFWFCSRLAEINGHHVPGWVLITSIFGHMVAKACTNTHYSFWLVLVIWLIRAADQNRISTCEVDLDSWG